MEENSDPIIVRVGTFFIVLGGGAFLLFVMSDLADRVEFDFLFVALALLGIGWYFRRGKTPPPASGRFAGLKNFLSKQKKGKGDNKDAKKESK